MTRRQEEGEKEREGGEERKTRRWGEGETKRESREGRNKETRRGTTFC